MKGDANMEDSTMKQSLKDLTTMLSVENLTTTEEAKIRRAKSEAIADYERAINLYHHRVLTNSQFMDVIHKITHFLIAATEGIKRGDKND